MSQRVYRITYFRGVGVSHNFSRVVSQASQKRKIDEADERNAAKGL